jgi:pyrroline-5-carboxylate reductase
MKSIGFIGGGRITRVILKGLLDAGKLPAEVTVSDCAETARDYIVKRFPGVRVISDPSEAAHADIVIIAVHPPVLADIAASIRDSIRSDVVVLSLVPKIKLAKTRELFGGLKNVARMNPNIASIIGAGFNPISFSDEFDPEKKVGLFDLFGPLGKMPEVADEKIEIFAVISAMGPTYLSYQFAEIYNIAREFGLSDGDAADTVETMVTGAVRTLFRSGLPMEEALDLVPVRPLADIEESVKKAYGEKLRERYAMLK